MTRTTMLMAGFVAFGFAGHSSLVTAQANRRPGAPARAVIFDTDVDFDDTAALAALAQQHLEGHVDLRAVTITNDGGGDRGSIG